MRESLRCWLGALPVAALMAALPMLLIGPGARSGTAAIGPHCGVAAWTGTCVCDSGPHAAPLSLEAFASSVGGAGQSAAVNAARRQCGMPAASD